jgi:hypothetical protein
MAKQFMSLTGNKGAAMSKAILTLEYTNYVLDLKDAVAVAELLGKAERYEEKYRPSPEPNTHHIYSNDTHFIGNLKLLSTDLYNMAKLAGKPE